MAQHHGGVIKAGFSSPEGLWHGDMNAIRQSSRRVVGTLVWALRSLEEAMIARRGPSSTVVSFLNCLDRTLTHEERAYVAMAFATDKTARNLLGLLLERRFSAARGAVVAAIGGHLANRSGDRAKASGTPEVAKIAEYLVILRESVLSKAAAVLPA